MRAIVTCGPSYEPIDEVRRITNFSTGELGTLLSAALVEAGVETVCLRGEGSTYPSLPVGAQVLSFATNATLATELQRLAGDGSWEVVFHCAALADYTVAAVLNHQGSPQTSAKIKTGTDGLFIHLQSAPKLLPRLRQWFPAAHLIGWKYELDGSRADALVHGARQIRECHTDASVVNGRAFGTGFGVLDGAGALSIVPSKEELCTALVRRFCSKR